MRHKHEKNNKQYNNKTQQFNQYHTSVQHNKTLVCVKKKTCT